MSETEDLPAVSWWKTPLRWWTQHFAQRQERILLALSILIGALTGLAVVAFILLTERLGMKLYPVGSAAWHRVLIPVAGSLGMGYLLFRYFPDARGSGVPQTKAALYAREGVITSGTVFGKFFCTAATLASGIPLGREGPAVQVGGGIASVLGRRLGLRTENVKALIPVGAAAAIAAAFNTPLAAVVFALEEIVGDLNAPVLGSVVLASATSWLVLRLILGNNPLFQVPQYKLVHPLEFAIYAALGVVGGLVSVVFTKLLLGLHERFRRLPAWTSWFRPVAGGLVAGMMAWWVPQVLGVGYGYVGDALNGKMTAELMALLVVLKLVAVTTSYGSGNAGGIFGPSLFIGAMLGGTVGSVAHHLWPGYTADPGAYALVGMGTLFAGIVRAPMTSVLMIFETTHDYEVIVPLMISNMVSFFISARLQPQPIYDALAVQDGIHLPSEDSRRGHGQRQVGQVMRAPTELLRPQMKVREAAELAGRSEFHAWPVIGEHGVEGVIGKEQIDRAMARGDGNTELKDLTVSGDFPHVHADHPLHLALERMGAAKLDVLPVVSRANVHQLLGIVVLSDVLNSFGIERRDVSDRRH
ncbi:MAG TPA: chloride channel protein [Candidatus Acidoferrales bacterium]|nr:chloride channel protein [Candidatus Acidoferrales bacterium]